MVLLSALQISLFRFRLLIFDILFVIICIIFFGTCPYHTIASIVPEFPLLNANHISNNTTQQPQHHKETLINAANVTNRENINQTKITAWQNNGEIVGHSPATLDDDANSTITDIGDAVEIARAAGITRMIIHLTHSLIL